MSSARRSVRMLPHEVQVLRDLYQESNIPTDQYPQRQIDLDSLIANWNSICGRDESAPDILHFMVTQRKRGKWVKLGRSGCEKLNEIGLGLSDDELKVLDVIHEEMQIASDKFALDAELAGRLQKEFAKRTNRIFPPLLLAAAMIKRRKVGALATLKPSGSECQKPFADMDKVSAQ